MFPSIFIFVLLISRPPLISSTSINDHLIIHFLFENGSLNDSISSLSLTNTGAFSVPGHCGEPSSAFHFDGSSHLSTLTSPHPTYPQNSYTYSMWFRINAIGGGIHQNIIGFGDLITAKRSSIHFPDRSAINFSGDNRDFGISYPLPTDVWLHIAVVRDTNNIWHYLNGHLVASGTLGGGGDVQVTNTQMFLGSVENHEYFSGDIDDVRVYDHPLEASTILNIYQHEVCRSVSTHSTQDSGHHLLHDVTATLTLVAVLSSWSF
mmetsp:Transcript_43914/g.50530  ORF Transcript_43914/g.50530 Transcript_43914/m.50530 type:complete len:263 (-) Transcript_43914:218-1006(-)